MDLKHTFTVPTDRATAWAAFEDIASVAECFPGATVTSAEGEEFKGTVKVKLGPIALQYAGQGTFLEKDEAAGRMVIDAKGRDKRGNGTAGAKVTATFVEEGPSATRVDVATDMQITGKPAQFGRGVIQDVSDKLLEQFVGCLQSKVGPGADMGTDQAGSGDQADSAGSSAAPEASTAPAEPDEVAPPAPAAAAPAAEAAPAARPTPIRSSAGEDDALDLGATVVPILLKSYGKQIAAVLGVLVVLRWLVGRRG